MIVFRRRSLSEPVFDLIKLYDLQEFKNAAKDKNSTLYAFIKDPVHFDYSKFSETWWPLFRFSDIGIPAMRYGKDAVLDAFSRLEGRARVQAERYANLYTDKRATFSSVPDDIPGDIKNQRSMLVY